MPIFELLGYNLRAQKLFKLSAEATINILNARPRVRCAIFFLKNQQIRFSWSLTYRFIFLKRHKNHFKILLEMSFVLAGIFQDKSVSLSIHRKKLMKVVSNVSNAKHAATFWITFLWAKIWQICCLAMMAHIALLERRVVTTKRNNTLFLETSFRQSHSATPQKVPKMAKTVPFMAWLCRLPIGWYC